MALFVVAGDVREGRKHNVSYTSYIVKRDLTFYALASGTAEGKKHNVSYTSHIVKWNLAFYALPSGTTENRHHVLFACTKYKNKKIEKSSLPGTY